MARVDTNHMITSGMYVLTFIIITSLVTWHMGGGALAYRVADDLARQTSMLCAMAIVAVLYLGRPAQYHCSWYT